jgi:hypothetical protein
MIRWPIFAIPVVLAATHRYLRIQEFTFAFALALIVTTVVSAFVPTLGIYSLIPDAAAKYPNLNLIAYEDSLRDLPLVRDGTLRHLEVFGLKGVVTFPSFHTASAVLYTWAFWPVRWMRPIALVANLVMLASCPVNGAHYMIDLAAGIVVAVLAIVAARAVSRRVVEGRAGAGMALAKVPAE